MDDRYFPQPGEYWITSDPVHLGISVLVLDVFLSDVAGKFVVKYVFEPSLIHEEFIANLSKFLEIYRMLAGEELAFFLLKKENNEETY